MAAWSAWRMPPPTARVRPTTAPARPRSTWPPTPAAGGWAAPSTTSCSRRVDADGIHACLAVIAEPNAASEALHAALGFERVGTLREVGPQVRPLGRHRRGGSGCGRRGLVRHSGPTRGPARGYAASMGATGSGPFENDDALDFLDELADAAADRPRPPGARGARRRAADHRLRRGPADVRGRRRRRRRGCLDEPRRRRRRALPARLAGRPTRCRRATRSSSRSRARCSAGPCARTTTSGGSCGTRPAWRTTSRHPAAVPSAGSATATTEARPPARAPRQGLRPRWTATLRRGVRCGAGPPSPCPGWWRGRRRSARRPGCAASATPCRRAA